MLTVDEPTYARIAVRSKNRMLGNVFRRRNVSFRTRSLERDTKYIETIVEQIAATLAHAACELSAQRDGLKKRLDAVITQAVVVGGNDIENGTTRDGADAAILAASDAEIARAEVRLKTLDEQLSSLNFLESALRTRFPDFHGNRRDEPMAQQSFEARPFR
jgi:hypothetical protein